MSKVKIQCQGQNIISKVKIQCQKSKDNVKGQNTMSKVKFLGYFVFLTFVLQYCSPDIIGLTLGT